MFPSERRQASHQPPGDKETVHERLGCCGNPSCLPQSAPFPPIHLETWGLEKGKAWA